jgi:cbb3-type cytochrome oxidase maturation protein
MDIIYILVPLSLVLLSIAIAIFFWAVKSGQFDDMDSPAHRILFDDDDDLPRRSDTNKSADNQNAAPQASSERDQPDNRK